MSEPAVSRGKRILLIDDQPEVRGVIQMMLALDDHLITEAANGGEALGEFRPDRFDLVITDYAMPGMPGDELAARIKQVAPSQPILMVTGSARTSAVCNCAADALLAKPFSLDALRDAITNLCSRVVAA